MNKMRILVHHSNNLLSNLLCYFLHQRNYSTRITDGSHDCLKQDVLSFSPDIVILGESSDPQGALGTYLNLQKVLKKTFSKPSFMLFFKDEEPLTIQKAFEIGIDGLIHEDDGLPSIITCANEIANENRYASPLIERVLNYINTNLFSALTSTEQEIMKLIIQGNDTRRIANLLFRSEDTIKSHRKSIKCKIGIKGGKKMFLAHISSILKSQSDVYNHKIIN